MINQIWLIYASLLFTLLAKILSYLSVKYRGVMYNKSGTVLTSIPEKNEEEEPKKWVPKKKHEVLKAKYKCLKKLFQIYDASVIGILPETYETEYDDDDKRSKKTRRKRSNRTKTDACAGTTENSSGDDVTEVSETEKGSSIATSVVRDLKLPQYSCTSTQFEATTTVTNCTTFERYATTENSTSSTTVNDLKVPEVPSMMEHIPQHVPYLMMNERPKLTRFQIFLQRIFGIKRDSSYKNIVHLNGHIYAASDNNITPHYEKRRRRGLRFRKLRRPKKIQSESALNVKSPMILTYVQSVQKNCLMDTTPRQCPINGCRMMSYGIINYNDHLNLCHFTERKYICHYCHEGFEREYDKYQHENEHIGINKLNASVPSSARQRKASKTQTDPELTKTDVPEEKLKKIVSFFDKISNPDQIISEIKKNRYSESNMHSSKDDCTTDNSIVSSNESDKRTVSCVSLRRKSRSSRTTPVSSKVSSKLPCGSPVTCRFCGENFDYRRQLSLHVDLEHRVHDRFSKFHSCAGITYPSRRCDSIAEDNKIDLMMKTNEKRMTSGDTLRRKSDETLSYEPSTNIVYYTSVESVNSEVPLGYKWEPGTKIIRV